ncbi:MAG: right-handed parallel beta-helix repeat-containing protein [Chloroflexota bacterium]
MSSVKHRLLFAAGLLIAVVGVFIAPAANAQQTFTVTNNNDAGAGSLRQAVADTALAGGDVNIVLDSAVTNINLLSPITINDPDNINIDGTNGTTAGVNIRPPAGNRAFIVDTAAAVTLQNMSFFADFTPDSSGITHTSGTLSLSDVTFNEMASATGVAVDSAAGILNLSNILVTNLSYTNSAINVGGSATLGTANNLIIRQSALSNTGTGLFIDTTSTSPMTITQSKFNNNTAAGAIAITSGTVSMVNSSIYTNSGTGLTVGAGGTATLSFVSIADNTGIGLTNSGTINAKNIIIDRDNCQINTTPINIQDRNFLPADCTTTGTGIALDDDPATVVESSELFLGTDSPAIDRVASCVDFDGNAISVDIFSIARPERLSCDVGSSERTGEITAGNLIVPVIRPTLTEGSANVVNMQTLTLSTLPLPSSSVVFTLTIPAGDGGTDDCELIDINNGNAVVTTLDITFNQTNWNSTTDTDFGLRATQDAVPEGDHTCRVDVVINPALTTDELYTSANNDTLTTPIQILFPITDDESEAEPAFNFDYTNIATSLTDPEELRLVEGVSSAREVIVTLAAPPIAPVQVWIEPGDDQCNSSFTSQLPAQLTSANWDTGVSVRINAIADGIQENVEGQCSVTGFVNYTGTSRLSNDDSEFLVIQPDDPQTLVISPSQITLSEGLINNIDLTLSNPIGDSSPDTYTLDFAIVGTQNGTATPGTPQCELLDENDAVITTNQLVLDSTNANFASAGEVTIGIRAIADGNTGEENTGCTITTTVTDNVAMTDIAPITTTFNIVDDPDGAAEAILSVFQQDNNVDLVTSSGQRTATLTEEGTSLIAWDFSIDRAITDTVTIRVFESARLPVLQDPTTMENLTPRQCEIKPGNGAVNANNEVSFNLNDPSDLSTVEISPIDDAYAETGTHNCTITVERINSGATALEVFTYVVSIIDNDENELRTDPDMSITRPNIPEGQLTTIRYIFTGGFTYADPATDLTLEIRVQTPDACLIRTSDGNDAANVDLSSVQSTSQNSFISVNVITFDVPTDANCDIVASLTEIPQEYTTTLPNNTTAVPDILLVVVNDDPNEVIEPTDQPEEGNQDIDGDGEADGVTTDTGTTSTTVTATPDPANSTPQPTATPDNVPSVTLIEGVEVLPVRTGPYLGATFVTLATRENEFGGTRTYRVLAKNNDENIDVTWFRVVVNGKIGWASGRSLTLNNITEEQLPAQGSVFDNLDGAPELGVTGLIVNDRLVYRRPSTRTSSLGTVIPGNSTVSIIGRTREFPYDDWYQVRYAGQTGWILSDSRQEEPAVVVNGDVVREIVPVR